MWTFSTSHSIVRRRTRSNILDRMAMSTRSNNTIRERWREQNNKWENPVLLSYPNWVRPLNLKTAIIPFRNVKAPRNRGRLLITERSPTSTIDVREFVGKLEHAEMRAHLSTLLSMQLVIAEQSLGGEAQWPQVATQISIWNEWEKRTRAPHPFINDFYKDVHTHY